MAENFVVQTLSTSNREFGVAVDYGNFIIELIKFYPVNYSFLNFIELLFEFKDYRPVQDLNLVNNKMLRQKHESKKKKKSLNFKKSLKSFTVKNYLYYLQHIWTLMFIIVLYYLFIYLLSKKENLNGLCQVTFSVFEIIRLQ